MARFDIKSLINSPGAAPVTPESTTRFEYVCKSVTNFCVLSDQATLIGINHGGDQKTILKENVADKLAPIVTYEANKGSITTLSVDEAKNALFAGDFSNQIGHVVQYDLESGQAVKSYGSIGIGDIMSSTKLGNLWIFGGMTSKKLTVICGVTRRVVHRPVTTAIRYITSLITCRVVDSAEGSKTLLFVFGIESDYSNYTTDIFDITQLVQKHLINYCADVRTE